LASSNNDISELTAQPLDNYLETVDKAKDKAIGYIKNAEKINDNFNSIRSLALKTEFLRTQLQMLCLKNKIKIQ
jgi:spore germination protein YaaH